MSGRSGQGWPALPFDLDDERLARAAWSRLAEPSDQAAAGVLHARGGVGALRAVLDGEEGTQRLRLRLEGLDPRRELRALAALGGRLVVPGDEEWPARLDDLHEQAPACLWVRGPLPLGDLTRSVAVVGARAASPYGEHVAAELGAGLAEREWVVVSGAAYGADGAAHRGALAVEGATAAVLACGVDRAYPRGHEGLLRRIAEEGLVVSEVPPGSQPSRARFLERNRLIAALASGTVVVEAAVRSGALSTANRAGKLGRPVMAVPGPVTSALSVGCHDLIRDGAVLVSRAEEVLELVAPMGQHLPERRPVRAGVRDDLSGRVGDVLEALPVHRHATPRSLSRYAGVPEHEVHRALAQLQQRGLAEQSRGAWRRAAAPRRSAPCGGAASSP